MSDAEQIQEWARYFQGLHTKSAKRDVRAHLSRLAAGGDRVAAVALEKIA